ncbi:MAG TPA: hypothetical protein VJL82_10360 [Rhizomicrobium sp.]|nr:hypothetical protein [Rhizomicrobium sp.]
MKRRTILAGMAAAGAAVAAGLYRFTDLIVTHYAPTPYDDVLAHLVDRAQAARIGTMVKGAPDAPQLAARLRANLTDDVAAAAKSDVAAGRLIEADGWLLPQSVALLAALAAKA